MTRLAAMLPDINYDLCVLTGDYRAETFGAYEPALAGMEKICSILKRPIYGVLGNHDTSQSPLRSDGNCRSLALL